VLMIAMNITLIGMSGVGKSRIGRLLSKKLNYNFIDIDRLIETNYNKKLQELIDCIGDEKFLEVEEQEILSIKNANNSVISPGGSSIYSDRAMYFLKSISTIVFLNASLQQIKTRAGSFSKRGIVGLKEKGVEKLFEERLPFYKRYADITVNVEEFDAELIANMIIKRTV
jgi:shikimate kinase